MNQDDTELDLWKLFTQTVKPLACNDLYRNEETLGYKKKTITNPDGTIKQIVKINPVNVILQKDQIGYNHPLTQGASKPVISLNIKDVKQKEIKATIDLHGMNRQTAETALLHFFDRAQHNQYRYVLIITGKGTDNGSIIRNFTIDWMKSHFEYVIGFCHALPKDGGSGAFYVHVRRIKVI